MNGFSVTFETVTPESAEYGDAEERGLLLENATLRDAVAALGRGEGGVEANEYPLRRPRWITAHKVDEDISTGAVENRSLHIPETVTASSRIRIARLLGVTP